MPTRILIVEDNPVARGFLARVVRESFSDAIDLVECASLAAAHAAIDAARVAGGSASPAQDAAAARQFRLVLCALELADGHGLELLEEIRTYPATRIATTLYSDDDHLFPALQLGTDGYLLKEDRFEVLVEELQRIVRGQPSMSPSIARRVTGFFKDLAAQQQRSTSRLSTSASNSSVTLSAREVELLGYLSKGFTMKEITRLTAIRCATIGEHVQAIYRKLAASSVNISNLLGEDHTL